MTPAEVGPSAGGDTPNDESPAAQGAFDNSLFRQILDTVPFGLFVLDADGKPVYANSRAAEILHKGASGSVPLEKLAEEYSAYVAGTDEPYPVDRMPIVRALAGETSSVSDMELRHASGVTSLEVSGAPLLDASGRVKHAVAVFHDVTATREVEATLRRLTGELDARVRERSEQLETLQRAAEASLGNGSGAAAGPEGDDDLEGPCSRCIIVQEVEQLRESARLAKQALALFIANFNHELRTPLNHIIGFSDLIESKLQKGVTHGVEKHAENIRKSGATLLDTLNKIISIAEAESNDLVLSIEILDVAQFLRDIAEKFAPIAEHNGNRFELLIEGKLGLVQTDPACVRSALEQIVENACKHCRAGSVTVSASRTGEGNGGSIEVVVSDTGRGIDPRRGALLVEGRVVPDDSLRGTGLGIGIPIAARSLRALGGSLAFTTDPGTGTRFVVTFPVYRRA